MCACIGCRGVHTEVDQEVCSASVGGQRGGPDLSSETLVTPHTHTLILLHHPQEEQHHRSMAPRMDSRQYTHTSHALYPHLECVCVFIVWPMDNDELTQPSDDEGEVMHSVNPMLLRKWLG